MSRDDLFSDENPYAPPHAQPGSPFPPPSRIAGLIRMFVGGVAVVISTFVAFFATCVTSGVVHVPYRTILIVSALGALLAGAGVYALVVRWIRGARRRDDSAAD